MDDIFSMFFGNSGGPFGFGGLQGMPHGMPPGAKIHMFHGGPMGFHQAISKPPPIIKTIEILLEQVLTGANVKLEIERWIIENGVKVNEIETIYVPIPEGIDENELIILRDKGNIFKIIIIK
jgi:DnaJ-class molecular chaperone